MKQIPFGIGKTFGLEGLPEHLTVPGYSELDKTMLAELEAEGVELMGLVIMDREALTVKQRRVGTGEIPAAPIRLKIMAVNGDDSVAAMLPLSNSRAAGKKGIEHGRETKPPPLRPGRND